MSSTVSPSSSSSYNHFFQEAPEVVIKKEVKEEVSRLWPREELVQLTDRRIKHVQDELTPRLENVERQLAKIGDAIKNVASTVFDIKTADKGFFERVKGLEGRIEKMLSPSEEYMNLQSQNRRDLIAIIVTIVSVAALILAAITAGILL